MDHLRSGVQDQPGQRGKTPSLLNENTKISQASSWWWWAPVVPVLGRLRQENHLNQGVGGYRAEIVSLHSSLGDREKLHLKKTKTKTKTKLKEFYRSSLKTNAMC